MTNKHQLEKNDRCEHKTLFSVTHSIMLLLQKSTNMQTHEIMSILTEQYEKIVEEYELDLNKKSAKRIISYWSNHKEEWIPQEKRIKKHITFPNTDVVLSCNISIWWHADDGVELRPGTYDKSKKKNVLIKFGPNTNIVKFNVIMPQSKLFFNSEDIGKLVLEGDLLDASEDIDELQKKDSVTPAQRKARAEQQKKEKEERYLNKILNKKANNKKLTRKEKDFLMNKGLIGEMNKLVNLER